MIKIKGYKPVNDEFIDTEHFFMRNAGGIITEINNIPVVGKCENCKGYIAKPDRIKNKPVGIFCVCDNPFINNGFVCNKK